MNRTRVFRIVQALLCALIALLLCASAVDIYRQGAANQAEHPLEAIYTPEAIAGKLAPVAPLFFISVGLTAAGLLLGAGDEAGVRPAKTSGGIASTPRKEASGRRAGILRAVIVAAAAAFILMGIFNGSARDVLYKAANICTECIGLG